MSSFKKECQRAIKAHRIVADIIEFFPKGFVILDNEHVSLNFSGNADEKLTNVFLEYFEKCPENFEPIRNAVVKYAVANNPVLEVFDTLIKDALNNPKYKDMPNMDISEILNEIILNTENFEEKPPEFIESIINQVKEKFNSGFDGLFDTHFNNNPKELDITQMKVTDWVKEVMEISSGVTVTPEFVLETYNKIKEKYDIDFIGISLIKYKNKPEDPKPSEETTDKETSIPIQ